MAIMPRRNGLNCSGLRRATGVLLAASFLAAAPAPAAAALVHRRVDTGVMGTSLQIDVYGEDAAALDAALEAAVAELERVEDLMTTWRPSPLTRLNDAAGSGPVPAPLELAQIVARGRALHGLTEGAFDITFYAVGRLWDFKAPEPHLPDPEAIRAALPFVDAARVEVDPEAVTVSLPAGMAVGLGGIAKGYGVDRAMQALIDRGVKHAMVNAGGDLKALGLRDGQPWEIAVKHPRDRDRALAAIRLSNQCLVTSGDYERFFEIAGKRYHHIIDPRTGMPARGCMSASVIGYNAEMADALATACCVLGPERGKALIESLPRVEAILVGLDGEVTMTSGIPAASAPRDKANHEP